MEALQPSPSKITKPCSNLQRLLQEIDAQILQFTNSPIDTPSLDLLAQRIEKKFVFIRNLLNAEIASHGMRPDDSSKIEEKITELESKFQGSNLHPLDVHESGDSEFCLNDDGVDESSGFEAPEKVYGVVVTPPEVGFEAMMEKVEMVECKGGISGGGKRRRRRRRWRWRTVVVLTTVSVALMVSFFDYMVGNQHEEFLTPT